MRWPDYIPNPGSPDAMRLGCQCPRIDNGHGRGYMGGVIDENGDTVFVTVVGCPLHDHASLEAA